MEWKILIALRVRVGSTRLRRISGDAPLTLAKACGTMCQYKIEQLCSGRSLVPLSDGRTIRLPDGRKLCFADYGDLEGFVAGAVVRAARQASEPV